MPVVLLLIALIGLVAGVAQVMVEDQVPTPLITPVDYLADASHSLTYDQVLADGVEWQTSEIVPNFGFRSEAFWFRVQVNNDESGPSDRLLELSYPILDRVNLYVIHDGQLVQRESVGDDFPFHDRPIRHRNFVFPLLLEPGETTLLLRIATEGVTQAPLTLWRPVDFIEYYETQSIIDGAYFGVMVIMVFYNLILYFGIRERPYLYYVGHVGTATLFLATMHGLAYMHVWPEATWWQSRAVPVLISLSVVFIALFVVSFLNIQRRTPVRRFFDAMLVLAVVSTGLSMVLNYPLALRIASVLSVTSLSAALAVSLWGWINGNASARFLVMAWGAFVLGSIALAMNKLGVLPRNPFTESGMLFGSMLDVVLLSIAMADRVRQERLMREEAQLRAMEMEKKARARLEDAVAERTAQLEQALGQLRSANQRLEQLSHMDGLTNAYNRRYFDQALEFAWMESVQNDSPLSLVLIDADHFKSINDTYGHLCGDEVLKRLADTITECTEQDNHLLARIGGEEFVLMLPGTDQSVAADLAELIRIRVQHLKIEHGEESVQVTVSAGLATRQPDLDTSEALVDAADRSLYRAKMDGRNRVVVHAAEGEADRKV